MEKFLRDLLSTLDIAHAELPCFQQLVNRLIEIEHNLSFRLGDISSHLCMSQRNLRRKSQQIFGKSPTQIITLYRIEAAKEKLIEGKSISEVADILGYSSTSHFSKVFKKVEGTTPSQYLKKKNR